MYRMRFQEEVPLYNTLQQLRGREGLRVRAAYRQASEETGIPWQGRSYRPDRWTQADPVNRALSAANSCLYGICHAAIVAAGYSPAIGFIHSGRSLSFVYDIADLYKTDVTIPVAFEAAADGKEGLETRVRTRLRDMMHRQRLLDRIVPDIARALADTPQQAQQLGDSIDTDLFSPTWLWDPEGDIAGGVNWSDVPPEHDVGDDEP
jgi:CRISPR-associated protein Cas1